MMKTAQQRALDLAGNGAEKKRLLNNPLASLLQVDERNHEGNRDEKGSNGMPYPSYLTSVVASSPSFPARYPVHFVAADVTDLRGVPDGYFDTVVDTFGLCSFDDPVAAVKEMKRVCKPSGQLLLLEHGRSTSWDFMNRHLDAKAEDHRRNWGCWWNREIKTILQRAGVNIADHSTFHFGSTHMIRGKPQ
jgi:SAM-dependent methyltransferase